MATLPILKLPDEILVKILSYAIGSGYTINMNSPKRRRWNNELAKLSNAGQKQKRRSRNIRPLMVCRQMNRCGLEALWSCNTFVFRDMDAVSNFFKTAPEVCRKKMASLAVGEGYFPPSIGPLTSGSSGRDDPVSPGWPPSMDQLEQFPNLQRLEMYFGELGSLPFYEHYASLIPDCLESCLEFLPPGIIREPNPGTYWKQNWYQVKVMAHFYIRDCILRQIPAPVFDMLSSIKMRHRRFEDYQDTEWFSRECIQYARDLRSGPWSKCPIQRSLKDWKRDEEYRFWVEARAALYWDWEIGCDQQWSTWAFEWMDLFGHRQPRTREVLEMRGFRLEKYLAADDSQRMDGV